MSAVIAATLAAVFGATDTQAQRGETITVKGGEQLSKVVYLLDEFETGTVMFTTGKRATPRMNYNMLTCKVQFMDETDTVLDIDNPEEISSISLGGKTYVYGNNSYTQYVALYGDVALTRQPYLLLRDRLATSGYGGQSSTTSASSLSNMEQSVDYTLPVGETRVYEKTVALFLMKNGRQVPLSQKNLAKFFPKQKAAITEYLSENDVNLGDEEHVKAMLQAIVAQ